MQGFMGSFQILDLDVLPRETHDQSHDCIHHTSLDGTRLLGRLAGSVGRS